MQTITRPSRAEAPRADSPSARRPIAAAAVAAVHALGHLAQRQLPQGRQVLVLEEVLQRPGDLVGGVDLPGLQPLEQILDRQVQVDDLVGLLEEAVRHGLAHVTPVTRSTRSFRLSRCWMLKAPMTLMPASSSSSTSW